MAPEVTVFVAAHPDDEVLGAAAELMRRPDRWVVHVTDGAPRDMADARRLGFATREEYAGARAREACEALALAGVAPERIVSLGVTDQEAAGALAVLARRLAELLARVAADEVLTHPYEGGHPDHDATAFAVHAAAALLARTVARAPSLHEFASYHADPADGSMRTGVFLAPNLAATGGPAPELVAELDGARAERKARMVAAFGTQAMVTALFPARVERHRPAPRYRFTVAPHAGPLLYERQGWGVDGGRWRALAAAALAELGLPPDEPL
jgi:LmbE family N-acetylglucosaminyl deacetylase